jgi:hypothetical protein
MSLDTAGMPRILRKRSQYRRCKEWAKPWKTKKGKEKRKRKENSPLGIGLG